MRFPIVENNSLSLPETQGNLFWKMEISNEKSIHFINLTLCSAEVLQVVCQKSEGIAPKRHGGEVKSQQ